MSPKSEELLRHCFQKAVVQMNVFLRWKFVCREMDKAASVSFSSLLLMNTLMRVTPSGFNPVTLGQRTCHRTEFTNVCDMTEARVPGMGDLLAHPDKGSPGDPNQALTLPFITLRRGDVKEKHLILQFYLLRSPQADICAPQPMHCQSL